MTRPGWAGGHTAGYAQERARRPAARGAARESRTCRLAWAAPAPAAVLPSTSTTLPPAHQPSARLMEMACVMLPPRMLPPATTYSDQGKAKSMKIAAGSISTHSSQDCRLVPSSAARGGGGGAARGAGGVSGGRRRERCAGGQRRRQAQTAATSPDGTPRQQRSAARAAASSGGGGAAAAAGPHARVAMAPAPVAMAMNRPCQ